MQDKTISYNATVALSWASVVFSLLAYAAVVYIVYFRGINVEDPHDLGYKWFMAIIGVALSFGIPAIIIVFGVAFTTLVKHLPLWYLWMSFALACFTPVLAIFSALVFL